MVNNTSTRKIVLASASPRRQELLRLITPEFEVCASNADETIEEKQQPENIVADLALRKASSISKNYEDAVIIGADTLVCYCGKILGKPKDFEDAFSMLKMLSANVHSVYTGVCVLDTITELYECAVVQTKVLFDSISDVQIKDYILASRPFDKAGAYGIQDEASKFVVGIEGCFFNVMGLPVNALYNLLLKFGI